MASAVPHSSLPHRAVTSIRSSGGGGGGGGGGAPVTPHTPTRPTIPSIAFGSPSSLRAEDDLVVVELGVRQLRVGFAGDAVPKRVAPLGPEQQRRVGDFRAWAPDFRDDWRGRCAGPSRPWGSDHELWRLDVRGQDLALVGDRLERELRDAFTKYLILDSKPRRISLILPPTIPIPLLSSILNTIFHRFQAPTVSLLSSPVMAAVAAGTRSALVVDLGWHETTVTGVYEYREVHSWRTVRAGKMLMDETYNLLANAIEGGEPRDRAREDANRGIVSFGECEEVATRLLWCKRKSKRPAQQVTEGLPTLHEQDESETVAVAVDPAEDTSPVPIHLGSCSPPKTLQFPFSQLAEPCEATFFEDRLAPSSFDDHELPVHLLVYRALLQLPMDVRAVCMSRIVFTGGCCNIIGLRGRIFDEVSLLARERGWDPVVGRGVEQYRTNPKLQRGSKSRQTDGGGGSKGPMPVVEEDDISPTTTTGFEEAGSGAGSGAGGNNDNSVSSPVVVNPSNARPEDDQVERLIRKERDYRQPVQGELRVVDSLGPWCGASMAAQLKVPALAIIDRDLWLQHGVSGASRPSEVDTKAQQRQSMGSGGLIRGQAGQAFNWTLGVWGTL